MFLVYKINEQQFFILNKSQFLHFINIEKHTYFINIKIKKHLHNCIIYYLSIKVFF